MPKGDHPDAGAPLCCSRQQVPAGRSNSSKTSKELLATRHRAGPRHAAIGHWQGTHRGNARPVLIHFNARRMCPTRQRLRRRRAVITASLQFDDYGSAVRRGASQTRLSYGVHGRVAARIRAKKREREKTRKERRKCPSRPAHRWGSKAAHPTSATAAARLAADGLAWRPGCTINLIVHRGAVHEHGPAPGYSRTVRAVVYDVSRSDRQPCACAGAGAGAAPIPRDRSRRGARANRRRRPHWRGATSRPAGSSYAFPNSQSSWGTGT